MLLRNEKLCFFLYENIEEIIEVEPDTFLKSSKNQYKDQVR